MLESQIHQRTKFKARDFVRGLLLSKKFQDGLPINVTVIPPFVEQVVGKRVFRAATPSGPDEEMGVGRLFIATKEFAGFIDTLL